MENIQLLNNTEVPINNLAHNSLSVATTQLKKLVPAPMSATRKPSSSSPKEGNNQPPPPPPTLGVKFISAGLSACVADLVTFPLDTAKVRLQIQGEGSVAQRTASTVATSTFRSGSTLSCARAFTSAAATAVATPKYSGLVGCVCAIQKTEGVKALYNGLVPGLQRQMCFASIRIGTYDAVKQMYINFFNADVSKNNIGLRMLAGVTTGAGAVMCAQPTDVVKVRMQAQNKSNARYSSALNAYRTIAAKEGIRGLWKGTGPNVTRNSVVNCTELVSYDLIKEFILHRNLLSDNTPCHFLSAIGAGFCTTILASPVDVVKTRMMNSTPGVYSGALNCALVMFKTEGPRAFYKGFTPSFLRFGCWNIVMFVTYEQMKKLVSKVTSNQKDFNRISLKKEVESLVNKSDSSSRYM